MPTIDPAVDDLLRDMEHVVLGTLMSDGAPQASTLWYLWTGSEFVMSTRPTTAKWINLTRDPRCSVCVDDPSTGRMVVAYGNAELIEDDVYDMTKAITDKYYPDAPELSQLHLDQIFVKKRTLIVLKPDRIVTRKVTTRRG